jgi:pterin-4a-carbinolamine dehydratase
MTDSLTARELERELAAHPGWRQVGDALVREMTFRDFDDAMRFFATVAQEAVDYGRRPDMCIAGTNRVRLSISNEHHAGFTAAELRLAKRLDAVLDADHPDAISH